MSLTFLAAADLHLGKASSGSNLSSSRTFAERDQPISVTSASHAWFSMVELAISRRVDAVLLAGDIIDRNNHYFEARSSLLDGFRRLNKASIPVVMVAGNHDADVLPEFMRMNPMEHVYLLGQGGVWEEKVLEFDSGKVSFAGWSFPGTYYRNDPTAEYNLPPSPFKRIGLLHGDFGVMNSIYAPLTAFSLQRDGVDAWVLGHIHKPQTLLQKPLSFYPGSPQSLSAKEQGVHGCVLLDVSTNTLSSISLSTVIYDKLEVDLTGSTDTLELQSRLQTAFAEYLQKLPENTSMEFIADVVWRGELQDPSLPNQWQKQDSLGNIEGLLCSVRSSINLCTLPLPDLSELAQDSGLGAILAQTILDIEAGRDSEFLQNLRNQAGEQIRKLNMQTSYKPLGSDDIIQPNDSQALDAIILAESRALLSSLFQTKEDKR